MISKTIEGPNRNSFDVVASIDEVTSGTISVGDWKLNLATGNEDWRRVEAGDPVVGKDVVTDAGELQSTHDVWMIARPGFSVAPSS